MELVVAVCGDWCQRNPRLADALLALLEARGIVISAADRRAIRSEASVRRLSGWIRRAVACETAAELLRKR